MTHLFYDPSYYKHLFYKYSGKGLKLNLLVFIKKLFTLNLSKSIKIFM